MLCLYGSDGQRVNGMIPAAEEAMGKFGKRYKPSNFVGAGYGFLRAQGDWNGVNLECDRASVAAGGRILQGVPGELKQPSRR